MTLPVMVNVIGSVGAVGLVVVIVVAATVDAGVVATVVVIVVVVVSGGGDDNSITTNPIKAQKSCLYDAATPNGSSSKSRALTSIFGSGPLQQSFPCPNSSHQHANVG